MALAFAVRNPRRTVPRPAWRRFRTTTAPAPASCALALLVALQLVGCSHTTPELRVVDAAVVGASDEATQIDFSIDLRNSNDEPLELLHFDYELSIDGKRVFAGRRAAEATLSRNAVRRLTIPTIVREDEVGLIQSTSEPPRTVAYRLRGKLLYISPGEIAEILLDTGLRRPSVTFGAKGRIALGGAAPAIELQ